MITKTKRNESTNDQQLFSDPVAQIFEDVDNEANGGKSAETDDKYEALAKQLADLQTRLSESEKANMALISQPQWQSQVNEAPVEIKPETVALPDPALDPDGYDQALAKRNQIRSENERRRTEFENRKQNSIQEKIDDLWFDFGERYPDIADDKERIDFVSTQLAKAAHKRGVNVERYMFITRDKFMDDVAKKYEEVFGSAEGNDNDDTDEAPSRSRRSEARRSTRPRTNNRNRQEDEYVGRTAGVFGGTESGGRPSRGREDEDTGPSMIDDIQAIQRKTGFF